MGKYLSKNGEQTKQKCETALANMRNSVKRNGELCQQKWELCAKMGNNVSTYGSQTKKKMGNSLKRNGELCQQKWGTVCKNGKQCKHI